MGKEHVLKNEKGIVLIVALLMLLVLTLIGISSISTTSYENIIAGNERLAKAAFYASEAAIQLGLNQVLDVGTGTISKTKIGFETYYKGTIA